MLTGLEAVHEQHRREVQAIDAVLAVSNALLQRHFDVFRAVLVSCFGPVYWNHQQLNTLCDGPIDNACLPAGERIEEEWRRSRQYWSLMHRGQYGRRCAPPKTSVRWKKVARCSSGASALRRLASAHITTSSCFLLDRWRTAPCDGDARKIRGDQFRLSVWAGPAAETSWK